MVKEVAAPSPMVLVTFLESAGVLTPEPCVPPAAMFVRASAAVEAPVPPSATAISVLFQTPVVIVPRVVIVL